MLGLAGIVHREGTPGGQAHLGLVLTRGLQPPTISSRLASLKEADLPRGGHSPGLLPSPPLRRGPEVKVMVPLALVRLEADVERGAQREATSCLGGGQAGPGPVQSTSLHPITI